MRKFIVSDLHGNGNIYNSIMNYLENISNYEDVTLYINGDLIDRGPDSADMLFDVKERIENNTGVKIVYLGGNHELMMHQVFKLRKIGRFVREELDHWYYNGGSLTDYGIERICDGNIEKALEVADFVANLDIYQLLEERINNKPIVIVHAACPYKVENECDIKIRDDNWLVSSFVWTRKMDPYLSFKPNIGDINFFTIIGHTPLDEQYGFKYYPNENYMNIDGGCALYAMGFFEYDHTPLVEVCDGYLKILTFNNNNEIVRGCYFSNYVSIPMNENELDKERVYINKDLIVRKLIKNEDGVICYED